MLAGYWTLVVQLISAPAGTSSKDLIKELIVSCCWLSSLLYRLIWAVLNYTIQLMKFVQPYSMALYIYKYTQNKVLCLNCNSIKCTPFRYNTPIPKNMNSQFSKFTQTITSKPAYKLIDKHKSRLIKQTIKSALLNYKCN